MNRQDAAPRRARSWLAPVVLLLGGCAAPQGATIQPVVVHSESATDSGPSEALLNYYQTVFARMRDALRGGTRDSLAELRYLVQLHKKDGMVPFARERIEQFELLGEGLAFELDLPRLCSLKSTTAMPTANSPVTYELRVSGYPDSRVVSFGGTGVDSLAFHVLVELRDFDASGQFVRATENHTLRIEQHHRLAAGEVLTLPFAIQGAGSHVAIREVSITVDLLPGVVQVDRRRLPVSQFSQVARTRRSLDRLPLAKKLDRGPSGHARCCSTTEMLYPEGHERIKAAPLQTLLTATRRGGSKWFRHVFLAVHFMPAQDKEKAMARLIQWVRNGNSAQGLVAMGCLRVLSRKDLSVTDRDAWLRWWQSRSDQPK